jgi:hypothetical protein
MQETRKLSDAGFPIGPAALYTTIQRLLESRWIKDSSEKIVGGFRFRQLAR